MHDMPYLAQFQLDRTKYKAVFSILPISLRGHCDHTDDSGGFFVLLGSDWQSSQNSAVVAQRECPDNGVFWKTWAAQGTGPECVVWCCSIVYGCA